MDQAIQNLINNERELLKTQLVCTFTKKYEIDSKINEIQNNFSILNNKIFIFKSFELKEDSILTYNVIMDSYKKFLPNSIMVHQKRETNTIYTINALNELIMNLNNGILDKKYPIEWERYKNCALLKNKEGFRVVKIFLVKVHTF
jgi:hypothetical protein